MKAPALLLWVTLAAGCASVDVYSYQPRPLPQGSQALAVISWTLHDLRDISWSYGAPDPAPGAVASRQVDRLAHGLAVDPDAPRVRPAADLEHG